MSWTPELIDGLRRMWAEGHSASQIASELRGFTRNAVIGKVHRLGLSRQEQPHKAKSMAKPKRKSPFSAISSVGPTQTRFYRRALVARPRIELTEPTIAPAPKMLALSELTATTCRWPIGDPQCSDFGFCGHQCQPDHSYCQPHSLLSNAVRKSRRDQRAANIPFGTCPATGSAEPRAHAGTFGWCAGPV